MEPLIATSLKAALPALRAGFGAVRKELSRRAGGEAHGASLGDVEGLLDEAIGVLARQSASLVGAIMVQAKGLFSRPALFDNGAPARWIATQIAQDSLKKAVLAEIRNEESDADAQKAMAHYRAFLDDTPDTPETPEPDEEQVYVAALEFLLATLRRELSPSDRILANLIGGLGERIDRIAPSETTDLIDERVGRMVDHMRQVRFFRSAETQGEAASIAEALIDGRFRAASPSTKTEALAWCARIAAFSAQDLAAQWLAEAQRFESAPSEAVLIARAFVAAHDDWAKGAALLSSEHSRAQATAVFQILRRGLGTSEALARAHLARLGVEKFDSEGRCAFLTALVETGAWDQALTAVRLLEQDDYASTPALLWIAASVLVASCVPLELRPLVLHDVPHNPQTCPTRQDSAAQEAKRTARRLVLELAERCEDLKLPREGGAAQRYALWLQLIDPDEAELARDTLRDRMQSPTTNLAYLPLALAFGLDVDRDKSVDAIGQHLALGAEVSPEIVNAMTSLLIDLAVTNPVAASVFLERHRPIFMEYLEQNGLLRLETRILVDAGRSDEARTLLENAPFELGGAEKALLSSTIQEGENPPSIEALEAAYEERPQLGTLVTLLYAYRDRGVTARYLELATRLLEEMPTLPFALEIIEFLVEHGHDEDALRMLTLVGEIAQQSEDLLAHGAWLHFRLGHLAETEAALAALEVMRDEQQDRNLRLQLLVTSGRWEDLDAFLDRQWHNRAARSAQELAQYASLAAQIGARRTVEFIEAAVTMAPQDPKILVAGYGAATTAGLEDEIEGAASWIMQAAALSDETGPVHAASLESLIDRREDWEERSEAATKALIGATATLPAIAMMAARPWLELHLAPMVVNPAQRDRRHLRLSAPFSGNIVTLSETEIAGKVAAIDASALVTLAAIDALDALTAFETVFVAHELLRDLFEQMSRLSFHQPSRINSARRLLEMVANGTVQPFQQTSSPDIALVAEIGQSRATLLCEAAAHDTGQHIVVHPFPIRRVGSLLSDPAPLDDYAAHLCSCSAILDSLERAGQVTAGEIATAKSYFDMNEERWPNEPIVAPGAFLYLTELAVSYLRYTGLIDKIAGAGLTVCIADAELTEARALLDNAKLSDGADKTVARLRKFIEAGLSTGHVRLAPNPHAEDGLDASVQAMIGLLEQAPYFVVDDRFLNRHAQFDHESGSTRILSSIDLLQVLVSSGHFNGMRLTEAITFLRRAGAAFLPLAAGDLDAELARTDLAQAAGDDERGRLQETGELRALRENIRLIQARGWFDPASHTAWLINVQSALVSVMMNQWTSNAPEALVRARCNWLYGLVASIDWAESVVQPNFRNGIAELGPVLDQSRIIAGSLELPDDAAARFAVWLEDEILTPAWMREPRLRDMLLGHLRQFVRDMAKDLARTHGEGERSTAASIFLRMPEFLQLAMLTESQFQDDVGFCLETRAELNGVTFLRSDLIVRVEALYASPDSSNSLDDEQGRTWSLSTDVADPTWPLVLRHPEAGNLRLRGLNGLHANPEDRTAMLSAVLDQNCIARGELSHWYEKVSGMQLAGEDIEALDDELKAYPTFVADAITASFETQGAPVSLLVPPDRRYWQHLVGRSGPVDLPTFLTHKPAPAAWLAGTALDHASWSMLLAAHPRMLTAADVELSQDDWCELGKWAFEHGDVLAKVSFIEVALPLAHANPTIEDLILDLAAAIEALDPHQESGPLYLFSSLAMFVEGELSRAGTLADLAPWQRRWAAMAHAALLSRVTQGNIDTDRFARFCLDQRAWRFALQTMIDMRLEPRWRGDYMAPQQLRNEFLGRIFNAAAALPPGQLTAKIESAFLGENDSLRARLIIPMALLSGPLEGAVDAVSQTPSADMCERIEDALECEPMGLEAIRLLINVEGLVGLPSDLCENAAFKIRAAGARLLALIPAEEVQTYLLGLCNLAASHRLPHLAETVQGFCRMIRARSALPVQEEMQLVLHAAAAHELAEDWATFIGNWTLELAHLVTGPQDGAMLLGWLDGLGEIYPQLRTKTGRAQATLRLLLAT